MARSLARFADRDGRTAWAVLDGDAHALLEVTLSDLLRMPMDEARAVVERAGPLVSGPHPGVRLAPVDAQEVWGAGVTYRRSRDGRIEESGEETLYDGVYRDRRPELFFKASAHRVVGPDSPVGIRADSTWDVPEPELALVVTSAGELFGYTVGNDMSSRSIEGANALYLPQAKVYDLSCALGPAIVPVWAAPDWPFAVSVVISRDGQQIFAGSVSTAELARSRAALVAWLTSALTFPDGAVLLTGTGIVPGSDVTLLAGDLVTIDIDGIGTLSNPVVVVGGEPHGFDDEPHVTAIDPTLEA